MEKFVCYTPATDEVSSLQSTLISRLGACNQARLEIVSYMRNSISVGIRSMVCLIVVSIVLTWSFAAHSGVYRWIDNEGNVVFSDTPPPKNSTPRDIQQVDIPPVKTVPALQSPRISTNPRSNEKPRQPYEQFSITHPIAETAIRDNTGNVTVQTSLTPPPPG